MAFKLQMKLHQDGSHNALYHKGVRHDCVTLTNKQDDLDCAV